MDFSYLVIYREISAPDLDNRLQWLLIARQAPSSTDRMTQRVRLDFGTGSSQELTCAYAEKENDGSPAVRCSSTTSADQ